MPTFQTLTFNCFGVPTLATNSRLQTLAEQVNASSIDVVCLQEVQSRLYYGLLRRATSGFGYHSGFAHLHAPKGGLMTISRPEPARVQFTPYQVMGDWYTPAVADRLLHKGILQTAYTVDGVPVVVLNTHLSANYSGNWAIENRYVRAERSQLLQLASYVRDLPAEALVLLMGDFNIPRGSTLYNEFVAASGLRDVLAGDARPTYRPLPGMPARYALPIDFVFLRAPTLPDLQVRADLMFVDRVTRPGRRALFLSDHIGIHTTLHWSGAQPA